MRTGSMDAGSMDAGRADAGACREALEALISEETSSLDELAALLAAEHGLLVANDVDALGAAMQKRQLTVGRLLTIDSERRAICRAHGRTADTQGLEQLMGWCDPQGSLLSRWEKCASSATHCREMNDRNGALVTARMRRVETMLGALTGQPREPASTYGPKGAYGTARSGRVVSTEA